MRSYHTQLRGGGNPKWYRQGMELSRTQFRTKRPVVLLPESDVAGLRLPPMYFVKRSAEWKDGRTEVVVRKLQWKKEDAGKSHQFMLLSEISRVTSQSAIRMAS